MQFRMTNAIARSAAMAVSAFALSAPAQAATVIGYDVTFAYASGAGGWTNSYNGSVTSQGGQARSYNDGTLGSINDGLVPPSEGDNQLFCVGTGAQCDPGEVGTPALWAPTLTLYLDALSYVSSIDLLNNYLGNFAVGNIDTVRVTIGGLSEVFSLSSFGPNNPNGDGVNQTVTLSSALASTATSQIRFSDFTTKGSTNNFAIGEAVVNATAAQAGVPEPATWALMILGFGAVGGAMRRRSSVRLRFA